MLIYSPDLVRVKLNRIEIVGVAAMHQRDYHEESPMKWWVHKIDLYLSIYSSFCRGDTLLAAILRIFFRSRSNRKVNICRSTSIVHISVQSIYASCSMFDTSMFAFWNARHIWNTKQSRIIVNLRSFEFYAWCVACGGQANNYGRKETYWVFGELNEDRLVEAQEWKWHLSGPLIILITVNKWMDELTVVVVGCLSSSSFLALSLCRTQLLSSFVYFRLLIGGRQTHAHKWHRQVVFGLRATIVVCHKRTHEITIIMIFEHEHETYARSRGDQF